MQFAFHSQSTVESECENEMNIEETTNTAGRQT